MTVNDVQIHDNVLEQNIMTAFKERYPEMKLQVMQFKDNLAKCSEDFTRPIVILSLDSIDCILASFTLIKTLTTLNCPFELHFFRMQNDAEEISQYLKKRGDPKQETNAIILLGYPFHLSSFHDVISPWLDTLTSRLHAIDIEIPVSLPVQKLAVNARLPWTVTTLAAILSIFVLGEVRWWHFLAVLLDAYHEHLDVGMSSNYIGITDLFVKDAVNRGVLSIKPDINIPITTATNIIETLGLIFSPSFNEEGNIEKFLLKHEIEVRDKRTTSLRTLQDLTTSEKKRLISSMIQELGLTPESLIRKTLELKIEKSTSLDLKAINSILIEMLTDTHVSPTKILKMLLSLPLGNGLDSYRRTNGFNLETTIHEAIKTLKETKPLELNSKNTLWFKSDLEIPLEIKTEAVGFACRQLRKNILVSTPITMETTPSTWNHLLYFHWKENQHLAIRPLESSLEELSRIFLGFQVQPRRRHRCIVFHTPMELTMEQMNLVIQSMEEGVETTDAR